MSASNEYPQCTFCNKHADPDAPTTYRKVTGWEKVRGQGHGVHPIKDREFIGAVAHAWCLDIALKGGQQQEMFA